MTFSFRANRNQAMTQMMLMRDIPLKSDHHGLANLPALELLGDRWPK